MAQTHSDFARELNDKMRDLIEAAHKKHMREIGKFWHSEKPAKAEYDALVEANDVLLKLWENFNRRSDDQIASINRVVTAEFEVREAGLRRDISAHIDSVIDDRIAKAMRAAFAQA